MGTWGDLRLLGHGIIFFKSVVPPQVHYLFTEDDYIPDSPFTEIPGGPAFSIVSTDMLDRLDVLGFSHRELIDEYQEAIKTATAYELAYHAWLQESGEDVPNTEKKTLSTFEGWIEQIQNLLTLPPLQDFLDDGNFTEYPWGDLEMLTDRLGVWQQLDDALKIRATLEALPSPTMVTLDISYLVDEAYLPKGQYDPMAGWNTVFFRQASHGRPPILVFEGHTDTEFFRRCLAIRRPHLSKYFRFLDFGFKHQNGAPAVINILKSMAAAGIANRIVAVLDNDLAGHQASKALKDTPLPENFTLLHYPDMEAARNYPVTDDSELAVRRDLNGIGCSLELYLGEDVLRDGNHNLIPASPKGDPDQHWRRQHTIRDKSGIQQRFKKKLAICEADPTRIGEYDWSGMDLIFDHVIDSLQTPIYGADEALRREIYELSF